MNKLVNSLISITVLFILLSALLYLVPTYIDHYTSAAVASKDLTATFLIDGNYQQLGKGGFLIIDGRTAKVIDIANQGVILEMRGEEFLVLNGESLKINGSEIKLAEIK